MDRDHVIRMLVYPSWQTAEMMSIVDWLRVYNEGADEEITFAGFDVQQPQIALRLLGEESSVAQLPGLHEKYQAVVAAFEEGDIERALEKSNMLQNALPSDAIGADRYLRLFRHGVLMDRPDLGGKSRDAYMAQEVSILAHEKGAPIVFVG